MSEWRAERAPLIAGTQTKACPGCGTIYGRTKPRCYRCKIEFVSGTKRWRRDVQPSERDDPTRLAPTPEYLAFSARMFAPRPPIVTHSCRPAPFDAVRGADGCLKLFRDGVELLKLSPTEALIVKLEITA